MVQAEISWRGRTFYDMINNKAMADLYAQNAKLAGIDLIAHAPGKAGMPAGSTDMGNVSYVVPSIHPMFYIGTDAVNHTRGFTTAAGMCFLLYLLAIFFLLTARCR